MYFNPALFSFLYVRLVIWWQMLFGRSCILNKRLFTSQIQLTLGLIREVTHTTWIRFSYTVHCSSRRVKFLMMESRPLPQENALIKEWKKGKYLLGSSLNHNYKCQFTKWIVEIDVQVFDIVCVLCYGIICLWWIKFLSFTNELFTAR